MDQKTGNIYKNLEIQISKLYKHARQGSFKTRERYVEGTKRFCKFLAENYKIQKFSNICDKHIEDYIEHMQKKGLSVSTVKTDLAGIRFFHDQIDSPRNKIAGNAKYNLGKRVFGGVDRTWSKNEYESMVSLAREQGCERVASAMGLALTQGLRIHEVFRLDRSIAEATIRNGELKIKGKGGKERIIPLTEEGRQVLEQAINGISRGQKLFVNKEEKTHLIIKETQNWIARYRHYCSEPGRNVNMTFHGLRHLYACEQYSSLLKEGKSELEARISVSQLLGHERDDVTRIYLSGGIQNG